eukprot:scaffold8203_cov57-Attheya_sp.AAC.3
MFPQQEIFQFMIEHVLPQVRGQGTDLHPLLYRIQSATTLYNIWRKGICYEAYSRIISQLLCPAPWHTIVHPHHARINAGIASRKPDLYLNTAIDSYVECILPKWGTKAQGRSLMNTW